MAKYKNYSEIAAAFKSGKLQSAKDKTGKITGYYIMLDKGGCENSLNFYDPKLSDEENEKRQEGCSAIFDPPDGVEALFEALGIPCEWC